MPQPFCDKTQKRASLVFQSQKRVSLAFQSCVPPHPGGSQLLLEPGAAVSSCARGRAPFSSLSFLPPSSAAALGFHECEEDFAACQLCTAQREEDVHATQSTENSGGTFVTY